MRRVTGALLAATVVLLVAAGSATGSPGSGSRPSGSTVVCPPNPSMGMACELKPGNVTPAANGRVLRLRVARRILAMHVTCRKDAADAVTCAIRPIRLGRQPGTRVVTVATPPQWRIIQLDCATLATQQTRGLACRVTSKVGTTQLGG